MKNIKNRAFALLALLVTIAIIIVLWIAFKFAVKIAWWLFVTVIIAAIIIWLLRKMRGSSWRSSRGSDTDIDVGDVGGDD